MAKNDEKYAYLNQLSTEQLEEILRMDLEDAKLGNEDAIFHILEVIEQREKELPTGRIPDINKVWGEFQAYYHVPEGEAASLYPSETTADTDSRPLSVPQPAPTHQHSRSHQWLKQSLVAVIAVIAVLGGMIAAQAAGLDVFGTIGRWTDNVFHFATFLNDTEENASLIRKDNSENKYVALQEALSNMNINQNLSPTWFPEYLALGEPEITTSQICTSISLDAENTDGLFVSVDIIQYSSAHQLSKATFEKDANNIEYYSNSTQTFYLLSNIDYTTAVWSDGLLVQQITGNIEKDDIKKIIDSIGGDVN